MSDYVAPYVRGLATLRKDQIPKAWTNNEARFIGYSDALYEKQERVQRSSFYLRVPDKRRGAELKV